MPFDARPRRAAGRGGLCAWGGRPGATRWPYSSFGGILASIETRLFVLPDDTVVHPGHGGSTSIGAERPHLEEWRARGW